MLGGARARLRSAKFGGFSGREAVTPGETFPDYQEPSRVPMTLRFLACSPIRQFCTAALVGALFALGTPTIATAQDLDNDGLVGAADPCPNEPRNLCAGNVAIDGSTGLPIRMNATKADQQGMLRRQDRLQRRHWAADFGLQLRDRSIDCNLGGRGRSLRHQRHHRDLRL